MARTSSGSKRSNNPLQTMAMIPGAPSSIGKRTSASLFELAALVGAAQHAAQCLEQARQHFAIVELGDGRKARTLADQQPDDLAAAGAVDLAHENLDRLLDDRAQREAGRKRKLDRADHRHHLGADQFLEQGLLVGEVQIDRALGDAGALGDIL